MIINNGFPRPILTGVDDQSTAKISYEPIADSQHVPLFVLRTQKGPTEITIVNASLFANIYGADSLEINSPFHNHQTEGLKTALAAGNATIAIKRIVGTTTARSQYGIYLNKFGDDVYKLSNEKKIDSLPLLTLQTKHVGIWGDDYGISIAPAPKNVQMVNGARYNGFIYELRVFKVDERTHRKTPIYSNFRDDKVYFTLNPDTNVSTDNPYYLPTVMQEMYGVEENVALGLFSEVEINNNLIFDLHAMLKSKELTTHQLPWEYDLLSLAGLVMSPELVINLKGGDDGYNDESKGYVTNRVSNLEMYDSEVRRYFESMVDGHELSDIAKYPVSAFYDTGFSVKTKLSFRNLLPLRSDIFIVLSAFMVADHYTDIDDTEAFEYTNAVSQDEAINLATRLRSAFMLMPESEAYGTSTMRVILTIQSGIYNLSGYKRRQSIAIDLLEKISQYAGAGDGRWKTQFAFDQAPLNNLDGWVNVNYTYRSKTLKETCWDIGIVWVENNGTHSLFYPAFQTIYPEDTSTLNNIFTMMGCCYLNKVVHRVWANVTGNGRDPDAMLPDKISTLVEREVFGKFDNRFKIEADTIFTPADKERGYSWTTSISIYSNVTPSVAVYKITTHRMS